MNHSKNMQYLRTEETLRKTLLDLLRKKPLERITVREICEHAGVNRSTFYAHFEDIYNMMEKSELAIAEGLGRQFQTAVNAENFLTPEIARRFFAYIKENKEFYLYYLKNGEHNTLRYSFAFISEYFVKPICIENGTTQPAWIRYYSELFLSGILSVIRLWLEEGCVTPADEMADGILQVVTRVR